MRERTLTPSALAAVVVADPGLVGVVVGCLTWVVPLVGWVGKEGVKNSTREE